MPLKPFELLHANGGREVAGKVGGMNGLKHPGAELQNSACRTADAVSKY
uniref:Uncharacterized protein n=1 Tax=Anopheles minimus TaxID=112268 RepID=A0A182W928_9DIPT